jgi:hypothetical protein
MELMQRKHAIQLLFLLSTVSTLLIVSIITFVSLDYFHSNIGFLVYGQNAIINNTVGNTNGRIIYSNVTNSPKAFEATANPAIGAIIELSIPNSVSQENNTTMDFNNLNNNDSNTNNIVTTVPNSDYNTNGSSNYYVPSSSQSQSTNSTENITGVQKGDGQEIDTEDQEEQSLSVPEAQAIKSNLVIPDSSPFKSNQCTPAGSLEKFVPNPFMKDLNTTRFIVGNCITVSGKVTWTHYMNSDGDANFNIKLDKKFNSLLTPANNSKKLKGTLHIEVVCQGKNSSKDPVKINQCKVPKYDGPNFKKVLPKVGSRVQVTGLYVIDVREGGHSELHPAYQIARIS